MNYAELSDVAICTASNKSHMSQCDYSRLDSNGICTYQQIDGICTSKNAYDSLTQYRIEELPKSDWRDAEPIVKKLPEVRND